MSDKKPETVLQDPNQVTLSGNDEDPAYDRLFRDLTILLGLLAVLSAFLGLIGMRFGIILISSVYAGYRTIALSAALIWIVTGSIMVIHSARPLRGTAALAAKLVLAAIVIVEAIELLLNILGTHSLIELWLTDAGKTIISTSSAPMSPVASLFIVLAATSLFFIVQDPGGVRKNSRIADAAGITGFVIAVASFTFVLSYVFGDPFLYGTQVIPIAAISALAAFFTGAGLVTTAGPVAVPLKYITEKSTRGRLLRIFVPLTVIIILVQQVLFSTISAYHLVDDAILVAASLILFALVTGYIVSRISGLLGSALDRAERELVKKNEDLGALNEELVAIGEELRQNIDELGKSAEALRESEEKYRGLFDNVQESVAVYRLVYDENGEAVDRIFVDVNPKAIEEMGYQKREDIIGKLYSEVVLRHFPGDQKSIDHHLRSLTEVARSGKPLTYDTHFGDRTYITTQYPVSGDLVASSSMEITGRKQAEEALRESEVDLRRAQELLDSITKSTGVMIAAEDTDFRYTYFNRAYADEIRRLTGKELTLGMSMLDLFVQMPGEQDQSVNQWKKVLGGKSINQTISFENPGGEPKTFNILHTPIRDGEGTVIGAGEVSFDVTRQIQTSDELRKTSQYLENLINYANAPIIVWDPEFRITRFNQAFERLTGRTAQEVIGQTPDLLIPEKYRGRAMDLIRKTTRGKRWEVVEIPILHKNGEIRTVLWNSAVLTDKTFQTIIATIAQGQDITDRKRAEEALKLLEARERAKLEELTKVLDAVPAAVWISHDPQGHIITGNRLSHEWLNLPEGANMSKSAPLGERPETFRMFRQGKELRPEDMPVQVSASGKEVRNYEFDFAYPDGGVRHVLGNAMPLLDDHGNPRGSVTAFIDITDRRQAEEATLSEKKKAEGTLSLLNAALESTADGIYVVDQQGTITGYNQNFMNMWIIPHDLLESGKNEIVMDYVLPQLKDPKGFLASLRELQSHPGRESFDMIEFADGKIFERYSKPQKIGDSVVGRVWSFRDITDRKHAEGKLVASLQEKEVLLREIHHRVKNNLQLISGLLDMTRMRSGDESTNNTLTDVMLKIQTMAQIHTRLYESKQFGKVSLSGQIRDQIVNLSNIYSHKGHEISCEIQAEEVFLPVDQAIPCALVVNEVLSNAYKHAFVGRKKGTIEISAVVENDLIKITIRDDGTGLPADFDISRSNSLGLKLIRTLVSHQLKGSLALKSQNGTEMSMEFPVIPAGT